MDIDHLKDQLQVINDWIKHADSKLGFMSVFYIGILGFWISNIEVVKFIFREHYFCFVIVPTIVFLIGLFFIYRAFVPRLENTHRNSFFYFGTIAGKSYSNFKQKIESLTEDQIRTGITEQIHTNSIIASQKMKYVGYSIYPLLVLVCLSLVIFFVM